MARVARVGHRRAALHHRLGRHRPRDGRQGRRVYCSARSSWLVHQHTALGGLVAIAVHGLTLLGDAHLSPSLGDIAIPFTSEHVARLWTGLGVTGGWLAAALGLTYYVRDKIGPKRWRSLHKLTIFVYVLGVAHTLGAGTDAGSAVAAGDADAHRRAGAVPVRHARAHPAPGAGVPAVQGRRAHARERDGPLALRSCPPTRSRSRRTGPASSCRSASAGVHPQLLAVGRARRRALPDQRQARARRLG